MSVDWQPVAQLSNLLAGYLNSLAVADQPLALQQANATLAQIVTQMSTHNLVIPSHGCLTLTRCLQALMLGQMPTRTEIRNIVHTVSPASAPNHNVPILA